MTRLLSLTCVFLLTGLAGCAGGPAQDAGEPFVAEQPRVTKELGSIAGTLVDDEDFPVASAEVALLDGAEDITQSDADGVFVFNNLTAGAYRVAVVKLGFESAARNVDVAAGQVATLTIQLVPIEETVDPIIDVFIEEGFVTCSFNPYWPTNPCHDANLDANEHSKIPFQAERPVEFEELVLELEWTPTSAATSQELEMDVCEELPREDNQLNCLNAVYWEWVSGSSPLVLRTFETPVPEYTRYEVDVAAGFISPTPTFQQSFMLYISLCWIERCPSSYSAQPET